MKTFMLTRDEAVEVAGEMSMTGPQHCSIDNPGTREETDALIARLRLEADVRDAAGWWGENSPDEIVQAGEAPESFTLTPSGLKALADLLPLIRSGVERVLQDEENAVQRAAVSGSAAEQEDAARAVASVRAELRLLDDIARRLVTVSMAPASVDVPRDLLSGLLYAQSHSVYGAAVEIEGDFCGAMQQPWRGDEDRKAGQMAAALEERAAIVRSLDEGALLPVGVLLAHIDGAIAYWLEDGDDDESRRRLEVHRELIAWRSANGFEAVTT